MAKPTKYRFQGVTFTEDEIVALKIKRANSDMAIVISKEADPNAQSRGFFGFEMDGEGLIDDGDDDEDCCDDDDEEDDDEPPFIGIECNDRT